MPRIKPAARIWRLSPIFAGLTAVLTILRRRDRAAQALTKGMPA